jgi:uncharacterized phage-associated protein
VPSSLTSSKKAKLVSEKLEAWRTPVDKAVAEAVNVTPRKFLDAAELDELSQLKNGGRIS